MLCTGKKSPVYDSRDLLMATFLDVRKLPPIPQYFGHEGTLPPDSWRILANDLCGDCVFAGAAHETMLLGSLGGNGYVFNDTGVLADYSAVTGFKPGQPLTDRGSVVREAMNYRRTVGIQDFTGNRHKIRAYVSIEPGHLEHIYAAMYLFGCVGVGFEFPDSAMDQFNRGVPWSVAPGARANSGHYVPLIAKRRNLIGVSWGKEIEITERFVEKYCDECWTYVTDEYINSLTGRTVDGFSLDELIAHLALVTSTT